MYAMYSMLVIALTNANLLDHQSFLYFLQMTSQIQSNARVLCIETSSIQNRSHKDD